MKPPIAGMNFLQFSDLIRKRKISLKNNKKKIVLEESDEEIERYILSNKKLLDKILKKQQDDKNNTEQRLVLDSQIQFYLVITKRSQVQRLFLQSSYRS